MNFKQLAEISSEALLIARQGRIAFANLAACDQLSAAGPLEGRPLTDLGLPQPPDHGHSRARTVTPCEGGVSIEGEVWFSADSQSGECCIRWRATDSGSSNLSRFRNAVDVYGEGMLLLDPESGCVVDVNAVAASFVGTTREALMGRVPQEVFDIFPGVESGLHRALERFPEIDSRQAKAVRADGVAVFVERRRRAFRDGGKWLVIDVYRDITRRKQQQLRIERIALALDLSSDGMVLVSRDSLTILDLNQAACLMLNETRKDLLGATPVGSPWEWADEKSLEAEFLALTAQHPQPRLSELEGSHHNGSTYPIEQVKHVFQIDGSWVMAVTLRDITERHKQEARVMQLGAAMDLSVDAFYLIDPESLAFLDVNEMACRIHGFTREELMSRRVHELRLNFRDEEHTRSAYRLAIEAAPGVVREEFSLESPSGQRVPYEIYRRAFRSAGRWVIAATWRDISERKATQANLERMRAAVNEAADGIYVIDPERFCYVDVNEAAARLYGISRETLLDRGLPWMVQRGNLGEAATRATYRDLIAGYPSAFTEEGALLQEDGHTLFVEATRRAVREGDHWLVISVVRDVSARKLAEEEIKLRMIELARSNRELEQFAYITSHDLSEPLRMVSSYTQLLARRYHDTFDEDAREFMGFVTGGAERMKRLIDDLLLYSRAGRTSAPMKPLPLEDALDDALANLAATIRDCGAIVEHDPMPVIDGDRIGMMQLFQNLLANALKFRSGEPPEIRIEVVDADVDWSVSVSDNGIGIPEEHFERIFIIFQRVPTRTKHEGTGIGLSICRKIVERHGGRIWVESTPGEGTCFKFTLPKARGRLSGTS
ncbi:MAG: PAS domain S-box protein [Pseudomonadota bacterium]